MNNVGYANQTAAGSQLAAAPKPQPEVAYAAQVLESSLSRLEARMDELQQRLTPVVQDRPVDSKGLDGKAERQMFSVLGRGIMDTSYRLENIERKINFLLDNLAI